MILRDIIELMLNTDACSTAEETAKVLDEYGEDSDIRTAEAVFSAKDKRSGLVLSDDKSMLDGRKISCPKCKTCSPDKIICSASELLSGAETVHFGCCECGTQFTL